MTQKVDGAPEPLLHLPCTTSPADIVLTTGTKTRALTPVPAGAVVLWALTDVRPLLANTQAYTE